MKLVDREGTADLNRLAYMSMFEVSRKYFFEVVLHVLHTDSKGNTLEEDLAASLNYDEFSAKSLGWLAIGRLANWQS
jgi:hypothetical protein